MSRQDKNGGPWIQQAGWFLVSATILYLIAVNFKFVLVPLTISALIALMLIPVQAMILKLVKYRLLSTILTVFIVVVVISGILTLFGVQLFSVFRNMANITERLRTGLESLFDLANQYLGFSRTDSIGWLRENWSSILNAPFRFFEQGISSSASFVLTSLLATLGVFFMLHYKEALQQFILLQFSPEKRDVGRSLVSEIRKSASGYLSGLVIVMIILGILNSIGLWMIGIDYPIFFGSLAAMLAVIPYFGTFIGGLFPFLYAIATFPDWKGPLLVLGWYMLVQQLEGNLITPKVIGSNVRINFMIAFLSILIGGFVWGIAGVILSLPFAAIIKTIFSHVDALKPVGVLMGDDIHRESEKFSEEWDEDRYRLSQLFKSKK